MTTIGGNNIYNLAIEGSFDDCQKIVKDLFNEDEFRTKINMSGVNSINWAESFARLFIIFIHSLNYKRQILVFQCQQEISVTFMQGMLLRKWVYL